MLVGKWRLVHVVRFLLRLVFNEDGAVCVKWVDGGESSPRRQRSREVVASKVVGAGGGLLARLAQEEGVASNVAQEEGVVVGGNSNVVGQEGVVVGEAASNVGQEGVAADGASNVGGQKGRGGTTPGPSTGRTAVGTPGPSTGTPGPSTGTWDAFSASIQGISGTNAGAGTNAAGPGTRTELSRAVEISSMGTPNSMAFSRRTPSPPPWSPSGGAHSGSSSVKIHPRGGGGPPLSPPATIDAVFESPPITAVAPQQSQSSVAPKSSEASDHNDDTFDVNEDRVVRGSGAFFALKVQYAQSRDELDNYSREVENLRKLSGNAGIVQIRDHALLTDPTFQVVVIMGREQKILCQTHVAIAKNTQMVEVQNHLHDEDAEDPCCSPVV